MTEPARLHPDDVKAIARAVVALLREEPRGSADLIDAAEVGRRFSVTAEWVREHAEDLGVLRLGNGSRPRLRFDPERVAAALSPRVTGGRSGREEEPAGAPVARRRRPRDPGSSSGLLPVFTLNSPESDKRAARRSANSPGPATRSEPSPRPEPTGAGRSASRAGGGAPRSPDRGGQHGT